MYFPGLEGIKTTEWLLQEQKEADRIRKKINKIEKLCYKTVEQMMVIDRMRDDPSQVRQKAIVLNLFWAEVCRLVVPQDAPPVVGKVSWKRNDGILL